MFTKYQHLSRFNTTDVMGINNGTCYIFPKLDGANAQISLNEDGTLFLGSRNNPLSEHKDLQGFYFWAHRKENTDKLLAFFGKFTQKVVLFGEWLVPHTLKTYVDSAWKEFYPFDLMDLEGGKYISYEMWGQTARECGLNVVEPLKILQSPTESELLECLDLNTYLIQENSGVGEGIVIKNYDYVNKWGHTVWAKIVKEDFKLQNQKSFKVTDTNDIEQVIAERYCTQHLVSKERAKIEQETDVRKVVIPHLLNSVYHSVISDDMWSIIKEYKNPTINFKVLQQHVNAQTRKLAHDLFERPTNFSE